MISLEADYIGTSSSAIIVHGLKMCGGVLALLADNRLLGAHFTNITSPAEILVGCTYLIERYAQGSAVRNLYFVLNLSAWQARPDKYADANLLLSDLKAMFHFNGPMRVYDKNLVGPSVDVKIDTVNVIAYRLTPSPDPQLTQHEPNVKYVKTHYGSASPTVQDLDTAHPHQLQTSLTAWTPFGHGQMVAA